MTKISACAGVLIQLLLASPAFAATQFYKCNSNGSTQYQQSPCSSHDEVRKPPTVEELNAERQKKLAQERANPATPKPPLRPLGVPESFEKRPEPAAPTAVPAAFQCDGRKYCSQMTSCAEANYFLTHCPGVKMDGDNDGIPCEEQWCNH